MTLIAGCGRSGSVSSGCGQSRRRRACLTTPTGTTGVRVQEQAPGTWGSALPTARGGSWNVSPRTRGTTAGAKRGVRPWLHVSAPRRQSRKRKPPGRALPGPAAKRTAPVGPHALRAQPQGPRLTSKGVTGLRTPESVHGPPFLALEQTFFSNAVTSPWKLSRQTSAPDRLGEYYRHV